MSEDKRLEVQEDTPAADAGRREFLRKAAYSAPVLVVLGAAAHSRRAMAGWGPPPSAPNTPASEEDDELLENLEEKDGT